MKTLSDLFEEMKCTAEEQRLLEAQLYLIRLTGRLSRAMESK